ncbi:MAG: carboxymuconolactone decarboxylase family protein, partial [Gammaproteobacteria bacterium]|nr:carboxymuconolactone decarboxylase family protein [Gammaproteobacteria bacterium]
MSRLPELELKDLTPEQRAVIDAIESGPRGRRVGLIGPYGVWVRAPKVGLPAQALGAAARFATDLSENLKEVAICTVGAHYQAKFEFAAHKNLALAAGVSGHSLDHLRIGEEPHFTGAEALVYQVTHELLNSHRISKSTYTAAVVALGETKLIELVTIIGYYCMISH